MGVLLLAAAFGALTGEWLGALGLAAGAAALAANWSGVLRWIGLGEGAADQEDLEQIRKVAHDAAEDLARMEEILEEIVVEGRRSSAESASAVAQLKSRFAAYEAGESGAHGRLAALEARLESLDEAFAGTASELRNLSAERARSERAMAAAAISEPAPRQNREPAREQAQPPREQARESVRETDPSAGFLSDIMESRRRRAEPAPELAAPPPSRPAPPPPPAPAEGAMGDLAETLRQRAREARQSAASRAAAQVEQAYVEPLAGGGVASLTPLASLAAMAQGGVAPQQLQQAAPQPHQAAPQQQPRRGGGGGGGGGGRGGGAPGGGGPAPGGPAPGQSIPIYALGPRVVAGHQLGVEENAPLADRLRLAAAKAAGLAASGAEEGVHLPLRAAHLTPPASGEIEAFLRGNPELARRLVMMVPMADLEALSVEPLDALRALGAALRVDVGSPDGLNGELFSSLKVELAAAPGLLALAMAPHAMQMGMGLMASDVAEPVMLQALSISGIPLVSGPATELIAQAGPAPAQPQG